MKKISLAASLSVLLLTGVLSGCVISIDDNDGHGSNSSWTQIEENNREHIGELSVGNSLESVRRKMGTPDFDELLVKNDTEYRVLYYRTQRIEGDGATTKDECTPIVFVNGALSGFGEVALNAL